MLQGVGAQELFLMYMSEGTVQQKEPWHLTTMIYANSIGIII